MSNKQSNAIFHHRQRRRILCDYNGYRQEALVETLVIPYSEWTAHRPADCYGTRDAPEEEDGIPHDAEREVDGDLK